MCVTLFSPLAPAGGAGAGAAAVGLTAETRGRERGKTLSAQIHTYTHYNKYINALCRFM